VGYCGAPLSQIPFAASKGVITNVEGRAHAGESQAEAADTPVIPGLYATGWIKRGPVGLIGHTKGDALETITHLIEDHDAGLLPEPEDPSEDAVMALLDARGVDYSDWDGFHRLEDAERALGEPQGRERVKIPTRDGMLEHSRRLA